MDVDVQEEEPNNRSDQIDTTHQPSQDPHQSTQGSYQSSQGPYQSTQGSYQPSQDLHQSSQSSYQATQGSLPPKNWCSHCGNSDHTAEECVMCRTCGQHGHQENACPDKVQEVSYKLNEKFKLIYIVGEEENKENCSLTLTFHMVGLNVQWGLVNGERGNLKWCVCVTRV